MKTDLEDLKFLRSVYATFFDRKDPPASVGVAQDTEGRDCPGWYATVGEITKYAPDADEAIALVADELKDEIESRLVELHELRTLAGALDRRFPPEKKPLEIIDNPIPNEVAR